MAEETAPIQTTVEQTVTQEPKKGMLDFGIEALDLGRLIGVGLIILAAFCIYASYKAMMLPGSNADSIQSAVTSFERIELIIVGALAGIFTRK